MKWWLSAGLLAALAAGSALRAQDAPAQDDTSPYHIALLNYKSGKFDEALTAINQAEASDASVPVELLKIRILSELEKFDEAQKVLTSLEGKTGMTPAYEEALTLTTGDLNLRRRHFDDAARAYLSLLDTTPDSPDVILKFIYTRVAVGDFVRAGKYLSQLKPLDPVHPGYYFAQAAISQANGDRTSADQDIETVRTIYGITVANRYLKTYLQVFTIPKVSSGDSSVPSGKSPTSGPAPATP